MIRVLIIDDETQARLLVRNILKDSSFETEVLAECENLPEAIKAIKKHKPDLIFLDIEMPGYSGIDLLDFFNDDEIDFHIVFVTAYHSYAIQAFKLSAVDYVLKPVTLEDIENALALYEKKVERGNAHFQALKENLKSNPQSKIAVPSGNTVQFIEPDRILFLKGEGSYTEIVFTDDSKLMVSRNLKNFEEAFEFQDRFFRCHKSYIVNTNFITSYLKSDGGFIVLKEKHHISIAQEKVNELLEKVRLIKR